MFEYATPPTPAQRVHAVRTRPSADPIGVAFLGCGRVTAQHSRTLRRFPAVQRFYASRDSSRASAFCDYHVGAGAFGSYRDALADPRVDVAIVATPPDSHRALAVEALQAGKHVWIEKPAFLHSDDFTSVALAARAAHRLAFVTENYVYKPLARTLRDVLQRGDIGDLRFVHVDATKRQPARGWRADPAMSGGGALFEGGIHWISLMANLGPRVVEVRGVRAGPGRGPEAERSSTVVFRYAGGAVGTLLHSWEVPSTARGVRLSAMRGTRGSVVFESNGLFVCVGGRRPRLLVPSLRDLRGFRAMFADALRAVRTGDPPLYSLADARRDLELTEAACGDRKIARRGARLAWTH